MNIFSSKTAGWIKKTLAALLLTAAVLYLSALSFLWWAMRQSPETFGHVMARVPGTAVMVFPFETLWTQARAGSLHTGDPAPDFSLLKLDKSEQIQLSNLYREKPVVLIFGS